MPIDFEVNEGIAVIVMNRPERLNALNAEAYSQLSEAWTQVRDDDRIRAAVITGAGERAFTSGADLKDFIPDPADLSSFWMTQRDLLLNRGLEVWKPVIAAVNGVCVGGGMTLLFATDIRVASSHATFALAEPKRGILAANGGTQRIAAQLPIAIAMEIALTGESFNAEKAERWGLINAVVPADQLMETALDYAARCTRMAPLAVQATKELVLRSRDMDISTGLRIEQAMARLLQFTEDGKEGPRAFAEKREPRFEGR